MASDAIDRGDKTDATRVFFILHLVEAAIVLDLVVVISVLAHQSVNSRDNTTREGL